MLNTKYGSQLWAYREEQDSKKNASEEVKMKYGMGGDCKIIHTYKQEVTDIGWKLDSDMRVKINSCVVAKTGLEYNSWNMKAWELHGKILSTPNIRDKVNEFKQYLKSFGEKLDEYGSRIFNSPNMTEADTIASQMTQYHDDNLGTIYACKQQALEDFEVKVMGVKY